MCLGCRLRDHRHPSTGSRGSVCRGLGADSREQGDPESGLAILEPVFADFLFMRGGPVLQIGTFKPR